MTTCLGVLVVQADPSWDTPTSAATATATVPATGSLRRTLHSNQGQETNQDGQGQGRQALEVKDYNNHDYQETNHPEEWTQFKHFWAHNKTMTCTADEHARPFNNQIRGVNLGGWMVLEPWITPSLFYQFLGKGRNTTAFDTYTFCQVLGPKEANRQLKNHWDRWVTPEIIAQLAHSGAVNSLRLPVGDYMFQPYGPYVGCFDGALDYVEDLLDWAYSHGLSVLLDIHTMKDSQNGFDNSGQATGFEWTSALRYVFSIYISLSVSYFCYQESIYH